MLSKRWDTAGRWCIYALLLIVFVGPFWGIVATAFSGAPVKPGSKFCSECGRALS